MADLIDREALIAKCGDWYVEEGPEDGFIGTLKTLLDIAPAVDAEPVKRGKWIRVSGYFTPGGDPVWKCSECGKGVHVYGIEASSYQRDVSDQQWVSCPNCRAIMEVEG